MILVRTEVSDLCSRNLSSASDGHLGQLHVAVDVEPVVLAGEHHGPVVHQGDVETLGVLDLAFESGD